MRVKKELLKKLTNEVFEKWKNILTEAVQEKLSSTEVWDYAKELGVDFHQFTKEQLLEGYYLELEHSNTVHDHKEIIGITLDHLKEDPDYYQKLKQYVETE